MPGQAAGSDAGHGYRSRSGDGTAALGTLASTPTGSMTGLGSTSEATRSRSGSSPGTTGTDTGHGTRS